MSVTAKVRDTTLTTTLAVCPRARLSTPWQASRTTGHYSTTALSVMEGCLASRAISSEDPSSGDAYVLPAAADYRPGYHPEKPFACSSLVWYDWR